ncbi:MAG: shikimate dehydrogenase [Alphaproteobacteria bacterium]|nr:shikimate dehydrogenase [Alphaproteobacteria bacterium]
MTIKAGVIGWPVAHSLSPVLHDYWLKQDRIDGSYEKIAAAPEDFAATIRRLRDEGYAGVNVTAPHKEAAFKLTAQRDGYAQLTGAANLLAFAGSGIFGRNTDAVGLYESLKESLGTNALEGKTIVLLGAGGAARGALLALHDLKIGLVYLLNRNRQRAASLASDLQTSIGTNIVFGGLEDWKQAARESALAINSTSAGMGSTPPLDLDLSVLPQGAAVCDIVYHPLETQLLKDAKARGLKTIDGLGMLMHQAVPSFEAFFGARPEVTPGLRAALEAELKSRG